MEPIAQGKTSEGSQGGAVLAERLLATKLYAPHTRTNLVKRPRLIERLDEGARGKLTLLCAPAGSGKTTLLGEWVVRSESSVAWLSLDEGDNDPARFFAYLVAALRTVDAGIGNADASPLRTPQPPSRALLTELLNEMAAVPQNLLLVLDDYHLIEDEAVNAALVFLLEHLPPQIHLLIASRTEPPLPLARLFARGHLTELGASDLRFTYQEAADFLNEVMGLGLPAEAIAALEERTEGWIAGLQLAALSMRGRQDVSGFVAAFAGTNRHVFDYLAEEVLDRQAKEERTFLLQTSILDRLNGPLCDAVTGHRGGHARLEALEGANLPMVPLDDQRRWYRYHHLFSEFLREQLRRESPEVPSELHRRASDWHEQNGTDSEAIAHALAAEDFERAADLIERLRDAMVGRGEIYPLEKFMRALPEDLIRSRPRLHMTYVVIVLAMDNQWDAAEVAFRDIEQRLGLTGDGMAESAARSSTTKMEEGELARAAGFVATGRANIAWEGYGDVPGAIALNRRALELFANDEPNPSRCIAADNLAECLLDIGDLPAASRAIDEAIEISDKSGHTAQVGWSLCHLGRLQTLQGRLSEAMKTYERITRLASRYDEAGVPLHVGVAHVSMGELLLEWNDLEAARDHILKGIELEFEWICAGEGSFRLLGVAGIHDSLTWLDEVDPDAAHGVVPGYIALARVRQAQGDTQSAFEALRSVARVAQNSRMSPLWRGRSEKRGKAWQARLRIAQGDVNSASRWAHDAGLGATDDLAYSHESELEYITLARLLIASDEHREAEDLLGRLLQAAEAGGRWWAVTELLVLRALVLWARNDEPGALAALRRALTLAEPEGYIRTFVDEGEPMADLLLRLLKSCRKERSDDVPLEYVGKLLEALGARAAAPDGTDVRDAAGLILEPITERELEVLKLLDSELSNHEIAARLFVSADTVKTHTRHLYAKLGVRARHQAVRRARDLKLL